MNNSVVILLAILCWVIADRVLHIILTRAQKFDRLPVSTWRKLNRAARILLLLSFVLAATQFAGYAPRDIWTALSTVLALVAVGFVAFWSALSNHVCGIIILVTRPFTTGDTIEIFDPTSDKQGVRGRVHDITAVFTVLECAEPSPSFVYIPHNQVLQRAIRVVK